MSKGYDFSGLKKDIQNLCKDMENKCLAAYAQGRVDERAAQDRLNETDWAVSHLGQHWDAYQVANLKAMMLAIRDSDLGQILDTGDWFTQIINSLPNVNMPPNMSPSIQIERLKALKSA